MKALDFKTNILATLQRRTIFGGEEGLGGLASSHDTTIAGEYAVKTRRKVKIGSVLSRLMREHDFSIKELAFESGVPAGTISHLKNNRPPKDITAVGAIADVFGISLHYLLYEEEDPRILKASQSPIGPNDLFSGVFEITVRRVNK